MVTYKYVCFSIALIYAESDSLFHYRIFYNSINPATSVSSVLSPKALIITTNEGAQY